MGNFDAYKKYKINLLMQRYNTDLSNYVNSCNANIAKIKRMNVSIRIKNNAIRIIVNNYNIFVRNLKQNLDKNTVLVNNLQPSQFPINILNKAALLIGSNYSNTTSQLFGCINDINFLKDKLSNTYGYKNFNILTDIAPVKPTRNNILSNFRSFLSSSKAGDFLFFGFSGHGSQVRDTNGDETDRNDETIVGCDLQNVTDDELKQIIVDNIKPNVTLFCVFDSCHSGTVMDLKYQYFDSSNYNNFSENEKNLETNGNVIMISGCMDSQTSDDAYIGGVSRGAMIWSFLDTINKNPNISYLDLLTTMRETLRKSGHSQIPQLSSSKIMEMAEKIRF
jgi:hypothetical protein